MLRSSILQCLIIVLAGIAWHSHTRSALAQHYTIPRYGSEADSRFGGDFSSGKDLDGDGVNDLVIGSPHSLDGQGVVTVYSGTGHILRNIRGSASDDRFGSSVASAGDLNGDGYNDILIGAPGERDCVLGTGSIGYVTAFLGPTFTTTYYTITGNAADSFGYAVRMIGDIDKDGVADFIVGQPMSSRQTTHACSPARGGATVYSGKSGTLLYSYTGDEYGDAFGLVVGATGDVNTDGSPDFAVSSGRITNSGYANVYSGASGQRLYSLAASGGRGAIVPLADINGDRKPDFLIGSNVGTSPSYQGGIVAISGADGSKSYTIQGNRVNYRFGTMLFALGDVNGDDTPDFVAVSDDVSGHPGASVTLFSGASGDILDTFNDTIPSTMDSYGSSWPRLLTSATRITKLSQAGSLRPTTTPPHGSVSIQHGPLVRETNDERIPPD